MQKLTDRAIFVYAVYAVQDALCNKNEKRKMIAVFKDASADIKRRSGCKRCTE